MVEIILYDVIINKLYTKSQLSIILLSRPLGATRCSSSLHGYIYKVPPHYCIMIRPLGATLVEVFMSIKQLQVLGCCKHGNPALGGYRWYAYKGDLQILTLEQTRLTRCLQQSWPSIIYLQPGNFGNHKSVRSISLSQLNISWIFQDQYFCQVGALKADSNGLFLIIFLYKSQCQQIDYEAGLLTRIF